MWRVHRRHLPPLRSRWYQQVRVVVLGVRGFDAHLCQLRASALTFYSLFSIVPVFAMTFGIAKGFGLDRRLQEQILADFEGQRDVLERVIAFANALLANTHSGVVAGVGVALLFWTVIKVLSNVEAAFNTIWAIPAGRPLGRKCSDYLSMMLVCPVLFVVASSVTVLVSAEVQLLMARVAALGAVAPLVLHLLKLLPFCVIWMLFSFIYIAMPNGPVRRGAGIFAGVVAGTLYQLVQWVYITFQVGVAQYNAIYGSFAALPLFLAWLQVSWFIVLFGAELACAHQNEETYEFEPDCRRLSAAHRRFLTVYVMRHLVHRFADGPPAPSEAELAQEVNLPRRLVRQAVGDLVAVGLVSELSTGGATPPTYQPARAVATYTLDAVTSALEHAGTDAIPLVKDAAYDRLAHLCTAMAAAAAHAGGATLLKDV
jgi:membrane protein